MEWRKKIRLLLRKLSTAEHEKYANFILPKQSGEINFEKTIGILTKIFGDRASSFNTQWNCLNLVKCDDDDFVTYPGVANWKCEKFKNFRLIQMSDIRSRLKDAEIRSRILNKPEMDLKLTLKKIAEEC